MKAARLERTTPFVPAPRPATIEKAVRGEGEYTREILAELGMEDAA